MKYKIKFTCHEINEIALAILQIASDVSNFSTLNDTDKIMYSIMIDLHSKFRPILPDKKQHAKQLNYYQAFALRSFSAHAYRLTNNLEFLTINDKISKIL